MKRQKRSSNQSENAVLKTGPSPHKFRKVETVDLVVDGYELTFSRQILCDESPVFKTMLDSDNFKEGKTGRIELKEKKEDDVVMMLYFLSPRETSIEKETTIDARRMLPLAEEYQITRLKNKCEEMLITENSRNLEHVYLAEKYNLSELLVNATEACSKKEKWSLIWESEPLLRMFYNMEEFIKLPINGNHYTKEDLCAARSTVTPQSSPSDPASLFRLTEEGFGYSYHEGSVTRFDGGRIMAALEKLIGVPTLYKIFSKRLDNISPSYDKTRLIKMF